MAMFKLLGSVPKNSDTMFYMLSDSKQNFEVSMEQFCYYLGKGNIENCIGYLKGVDVLIGSQIFGQNPINILNIPLYKDNNSKRSMRLSKRCRQGRNIVGFYITDGKSEIYKTRQEIINLVKSGLIENANVSSSNGEEIIRGINGTSLDDLPTINLDNNETKKNIDYSKFVNYIESNIISSFVYNNLKIIAQNKQINADIILYNFKLQNNTQVNLKLKLNNDIKAILYLDNKEIFSRSYTNNQNSASELLKNIHEVFKKVFGNKVKVNLSKPEIENKKTSNVNVSIKKEDLPKSDSNRNNNEYLRIFNNMLDTVSNEVFNKINTNYKNKAIHKEYVVSNNLRSIIGEIKFKTASNVEIQIDIQCDNESSFRIISIESSDKTKLRLSKNKYTFSNEGVKKIYSDILYSILTSGILDKGLEEDIFTSKLEDKDDLIIKLQHITRDLQSELSKRILNIRSQVYIKDFVLNGVRSNKESVISTMEITLSDDNVISIEASINSKEFKIEHIIDNNFGINIVSNIRYDIKNVFIERIAISILDDLVKKGVVY